MIRVIFEMAKATESECFLINNLVGVLRQSVKHSDLLIDVLGGDESAGLAPLQTADRPAGFHLPLPEGGMVDRIDFVPVGSRCFHCHRPLTAGTGYWVKFPGGLEQPFGGTCVSKCYPAAKSSISLPDFTRAARVAPPVGDMTGGYDEVGKEAGVVRTELIEEEYLRLRYERMHGFKIPGWPPLDGLYEKIKRSEALDDVDRLFIRKMLEKMPNSKMPGLSMGNLQACYAYSHCLNQAIALLPEDKREYLTKLHSDLRKKLYLTTAQIAAANKWLTNIKGVPTLDPGAFAWAEGVKRPE